MPSFNFDENLSIDDNLAAYFEHLKVINKEFGSHLEQKLPAAITATFSRQVFNRSVETMLDTLPKTTPEDA